MNYPVKFTSPPAARGGAGQPVYIDACHVVAVISSAAFDTTLLLTGGHAVVVEESPEDCLERLQEALPYNNLKT